MPKVENNFSADLLEGIDTLGSFSPEDIFYPAQRGFLYTVDKNNTYAQSNFSIKSEYGEPVGAILDSHTGKISLTNPRNAYQSTLSRMPVMGSRPITGVRNIIPYSNKLNAFPWFINSGWGDPRTTIYQSSDSTLNGNPIFILSKEVDDDPSDFVVLAQNLGFHTIPAKNKYVTFSIYVNRKNSFGKFKEYFSMRMGSEQVDIIVNVNLDTMAVNYIYEYGISNASTTIFYVDEEWARVSITFLCLYDIEIPMIQFGAISDMVVIDGASRLDVSSPQIEMGREATRYQDVRNNIYVNDSKMPVYEYIKFDSIDDTLTTDTSNLIGQSGTLFIAGVEKSFILPYEIKTATFNMGSDSFTNGPKDVVTETGGVVGWGFVNKIVSKAEADKLFSYYKKRGGSTDYKYMIVQNVNTLLAPVANTQSTVFWGHPHYWYSDTAATTHIYQAGEHIRAWKSSNGNMTLTQTDQNYAPRAVKLPVGSTRRNMLVGQDVLSHFTIISETSSDRPNINKNNIKYDNEYDVFYMSFRRNQNINRMTSYSGVRLNTATLTDGVTYTLSFMGKSAYQETQPNLVLRRTVDDPAPSYIQMRDYWQKFNLTFTKTANTSVDLLIIRADPNTSHFAEFYMTNVQLEVGSASTKYQYVISEYEVIEKDKESVWFARFDGVNDFMVSTQSFNFSTDTRFTVSTSGIKTIGNSLPGNLVFIGNTTNHFAMLAPSDNDSMYSVRTTKSNTANRSDSTSAAYASPNKYILTSSVDMTTRTMNLRVNRTERATRSLSFTAGGMTTDKVYVGSAGPHMAGYFKGDVSSLVLTKGTASVPITVVENVENQLNTNIKV